MLCSVAEWPYLYTAVITGWRARAHWAALQFSWRPPDVVARLGRNLQSHVVLAHCTQLDTLTRLDCTSAENYKAQS